MQSLLVSTGVVALAEIGDKTQLLAFILATRFKKPIPIILGILLATIINHGLAGALGKDEFGLRAEFVELLQAAESLSTKKPVAKAESGQN